MVVRAYLNCHSFYSQIIHLDIEYLRSFGFFIVIGTTGVIDAGEL